MIKNESNIIKMVNQFLIDSKINKFLIYLEYDLSLKIIIIYLNIIHIINYNLNFYSIYFLNIYIKHIPTIFAKTASGKLTVFHKY